MASAFNDKYERYKTTLGDTPVQFNTIMNIPFKIAYDMYIRDEWFDKPYESFKDEIYIKIAKEKDSDDNLDITVFKREHQQPPDDYYFVIKPEEKKVFDFLKLELLPAIKIINICYAVMRAKDIYLFFVNYKNKYNSFPVEQIKINYLYHCGLILSSEQSILEKDELFIFLNKKTYGGEGIEIKIIKSNLETSFDEDKLFETEYYKKFQEMFKLGKFDTRLSIESEIANLYVNTILPKKETNLSGGKRVIRKKSLKKKAPKHKKKSIKHKKKTIKK
jgi:hypothetical protein